MKNLLIVLGIVATRPRRGPLYMQMPRVPPYDIHPPAKLIQ